MIQRFYNTYAILQNYSVITDDYGQETKTWNVSTYIHGIKQSKVGSNSIINKIEGIRTNERFYCDYTLVTSNDRLLFSTKSYNYQGSITGTSMLSTSPEISYLYYCSNSFSTYITGDFIRYDSTGFRIENFNYYKILFTNNLIDRHMQIDLEQDNKDRI